MLRFKNRGMSGGDAAKISAADRVSGLPVNYRTETSMMLALSENKQPGGGKREQLMVFLRYPLGMGGSSSTWHKHHSRQSDVLLSTAIISQLFGCIFHAYQQLLALERNLAPDGCYLRTWVCDGV